MKSLVLALSAILILSAVQKADAQEKSKKSFFIASTGYASFNNGKQSGISLSNEYIRNVNRYFAYGARYMFAHGEGNVKGLPNQYDVHVSTSALDINGFFKPLSNERNLLLLGLGITLDFTRTSDLSNTDIITSNGKVYTIANMNATVSLLEPVVSLHYYHYLTRNFFVGGNFNARDWRFYQNVVQIGGGVRF